jgi:hypothetical protein
MRFGCGSNGKQHSGRAWLAAAILFAYVPLVAQAQDVSERWSMTTAGGGLTAFARGGDTGGMGVSCDRSDVVVMFQFARAVGNPSKVKIGYSTDDNVGRTAWGAAPDPQTPSMVVVMTTPDSTLVRALKRGAWLTFAAEDRSGSAMIGVVTLRGSSAALGKLPCI